VFLFQLEFFLYFVINAFSSNNILINFFLIFLLHYLLLRYIIQSFLYILQFPLLKPICFYSIAYSQLNELLNISKEYVNLYRNLKKQKKTFDQNDTLIIDEISNEIFAYLFFYKLLKTHGKLSVNQNDLYEKLDSWMKNYDEYKKKNIIVLNKNNENNIDNDNNNNNNNNINKLNEGKNFIYYLRKMNNDSNDIIKIINNFICNNYEILSLRRIYNIFINNTFSFLHHFSILFHKKFNNTDNYFITSDNKIIEYTIVTYDKLDTIFKNKNNRNINNDNRKEKNLILFCNPNGMIYQLFTPERFLFLLEGGCDILFWNYRGYGYSTGYSTFKNAKTDLIELFDYIHKKGIYKKYGAYGYSVGGGSATFLSKNRKLDVLIADRNFMNINEIANNISIFGGILSFLAKMLFFKYDYNVEEFIQSKNKNICKVVLCDPEDDIIPNSSSLKSGISKYIIRKYCIDKKLKKTENILELFLNIENNLNQANNFIKSILYIMDILIEFNKNPFKDFINKNKPNKKEKLDKTLLLNITENTELNKKNFKRILINTIARFFNCFNHSSENLESFRDIYEKRLKILHINNYFNNFFIWGTINDEKLKKNEFLNPFDTNNNSFYLDNAIEHLNKFLNDKFVKSMLGEEDNEIKYNHLMIIKNGLQILINKEDFLFFIKNIDIGHLIRLNCGHNGLYTEEDEKELSDILKNINFIK
jgi:hypothetical protein